MRNITLLLFLFISGCSLFQGLEPKCQNADEVALGETYANDGIATENFDNFADQCAKYSYRVPSKEKFLEGYNASKKFMCSDSTKYFKASYRRYRLGSSAMQCGSSAFNFISVKEDVFFALEHKKTIDELDAKIKKANETNGKKKYDNDFLLDVLLRMAYESNPVALEEERGKKVEELKLVTKKYNLFISDLNSL